MNDILLLTLGAVAAVYFIGIPALVAYVALFKLTEDTDND